MEYTAASTQVVQYVHTVHLLPSQLLFESSGMLRDITMRMYTNVIHNNLRNPSAINHIIRCTHLTRTVPRSYRWKIAIEPNKSNFIIKPR